MRKCRTRCPNSVMMEMMLMHAYCFFCETQRCKVIAELIQKNYGYTCFAPQIIQRKWVKGVPNEEPHDWLPGYVFVYSDEKSKEIYNKMKTTKLFSDNKDIFEENIIKPLKNDFNMDFFE